MIDSVDWLLTMLPCIVYHGLKLGAKSSAKIMSIKPYSLKKVGKYWNYDFHFFQIGIQNFCNSKKHFNYCLEKGVKVITQDEISMSNKGLCDYLWPQLEHLQGSPLFISIDIDGFSSSFAPGCSQSWPTGITPHEFLTLFTRLNKNFKTKLLGIYEVAPNLDNNDITSKLAAQIMYSFVSSN